MSELLPSELARLILGYFESNGYRKLAERILGELPELSEVNQRRKEGKKVNLRIGDLTLKEIVDEYTLSKDIMYESVGEFPSTFLNLKRRQLLSEQMKIITDTIIRNNINECCHDHSHSENSEPNLTTNLSRSISISVGISEESTPPLGKIKGLKVDVRLPSSPEMQSRSEDDCGEREMPQKTDENDSRLTADSTPRERKGSSRRKARPSKFHPKRLLREADERMEELVKNLVENTDLPTKIADTINSSLLTIGDGAGAGNQSLTSECGAQRGDLVEKENDLNISQNQNVSSDSESDNGNLPNEKEDNLNISQNQSVSFDCDPDIMNLPDEIISQLRQIVNDPAVAAILAAMKERDDAGVKSSAKRKKRSANMKEKKRNRISLKDSKRGCAKIENKDSDGMISPDAN